MAEIVAGHILAVVIELDGLPTPFGPPFARQLSRKDLSAQ